MHFSRESACWIGAVLLLVCATASVSSSDDGDTDKNGIRAPSPHQKINHRTSRAVHEIFLSDPLDCLSQLVCGLNTFPPQVPTPRTSSANDYAYLLQHVVLRLKKQPVIPTVNSIIITTPASPVDEDKQDDDDDNDEEEEDDAVESDEEDTSAEKHRKKLLKDSKDQNGDVVEMKGLYPPLGTVDFYRNGRAINKENSKIRKKKYRDGKKKETKTQTPKPTKDKKKQAPRIPTTQSPLQLLRREQDIREKLKSNARCLYGILEHTCPFKYSELLLLMSAVLERQKVISYSTNTILPMAGYLLKSRSLTQTMKATFFALERINNVTLANMANIHEPPPTFSNVYDEIIRGEFPGNGIHIVETRIDAPASTHAWEDDEFDAALKNPFLPRDQIPGYAIKDRTKNKKKASKESVENNNNSAEEDQEEEINGFAVTDFLNNRPPEEEGDEEEITEYYDDNDSSSGNNGGGDSPEDRPLPPVYGSSNKYQNNNNNNAPKTRRRRN